MLPADSQTLQKLDLFFSPGKLENYKNSAPEGALYTDLNDYDLSEPALEAMCKRHLYAPSAFLAMEPYRMFDLSWKLGQCLPAREFDDWFSAIVTATTNGAIRLKLVDLARDSSLTGKLSAVTRSALIRTLDLKDPDQQNALRWFVQEDVASLTETPDPNRAEQTAEHALSLAASRSENASWDDYESLRKLSANLPEAGRIEFIKQMGRLVMSSHRATLAKEKYDEGLFEFFLEQIDQDPSIEYLPELVAIDLTHISKSSQNRVEYRVSILNAGVTIANKHPSSSREIYSSLNKWAEDEKIFTPAIILSLDDEKPRDKQKRWISTLKKFKSLIK